MAPSYPGPKQCMPEYVIYDSAVREDGPETDRASILGSEPDAGSRATVSRASFSKASFSRVTVSKAGADIVADVVAGGVVGVLAGIGSFVFLRSLTWATTQRLEHGWLLWFLPLAGLVLGTVNHRIGGSATRGTNLVLDEIFEPAGDAPPFRMTTLAMVGATITHLFGGSGGREGAAVQIAAGLTAPLRRAFPSMSRRRLALAAMSGGFGSVFGVPFAGAVFGLEVQVLWRIRLRHVVTAIVASFVGDRVTRGLGLRHDSYAHFVMRHTPRVWLGVVLVGVCSGLCAALFIEANHGLKYLMVRYVRIPGVRLAIGGVLVITGVVLTGTRTYLGLSLPLIDLALAGGAVASFAFAIKLAFTVVTLGSGFPGGEVAPLFCVGACLGSTLAQLADVSPLILVPVAFVSVFGAASHTPLACALVATELFGSGAAAPAIVACVLASLFCGRRSIYGHQRIAGGQQSAMQTMTERERARIAGLLRWRRERAKATTGRRDQES